MLSLLGIQIFCFIFSLRTILVNYLMYIQSNQFVDAHTYVQKHVGVIVYFLTVVTIRYDEQQSSNNCNKQLYSILKYVIK